MDLCEGEGEGLARVFVALVGVGDRVRDTVDVVDTSCVFAGDTLYCG